MADYLLISEITGFMVYNEADLPDTLTPLVSGYTFATPFVLRMTLTSGTSPVNILNGCTVVWHFGDGTEVQTTDIQYNSIQSPAHKYNWPGTYEVKLSVASNDGILTKTFSKTLKITNYVKDSLKWNYTDWADLKTNNLANGAVFHGYQSCKPGKFNQSLPLTIDFVSSTLLSGAINFNLYSQNSLSQPWDVATYENKYANLRPRWRFLDLNNEVVNSIGPNLTQISPIIIDAQGVPASSTSFDSTTQTIVGYTGSVSFYYIDDLPSLYFSGGTWNTTVPTLWITSDTFSYPNYQDKNDGNNPSYANNSTSLSSYFYVKNLSATHYNLTINGGNIPVPSTLWPGITGQAFVTVNSDLSSTSINADYSDKVLLNYPLNPTADNSLIRIRVTPAEAITFSDSRFRFLLNDSLNRNTGGFKEEIYHTINKNSPLLSAGTLPVTATITSQAFNVVVEPSPDPLSGYNPLTRPAAAVAADATKNITLSGEFVFDIVNYDKVYFVRKINEDFNYGGQLQSYALQPTIAANTNLFLLLSAMAGTSYTTQDTFGTVVYEKITNFVANIQDIDTSNVNGFYSLTDFIDNKFDNFNLNAPPSLKRALDLYSVSHDRLWGTREKYNLDFNNIGIHNNLGPVLTAYDVNTAIVSAGQKIVLNDKFNSNFYELIEVPAINSYASVTAANMQTHFTSAASYPLTAYPLSGFYGWGVKTPVKDYYNFWVYNNVYNNTPTNNLIDWTTKTNGLSTTLSESNSSVSEWYKDGGILENIYSYYLYKGLSLLQK